MSRHNVYTSCSFSLLWREIEFSFQGIYWKSTIKLRLCSKILSDMERRTQSEPDPHKISGLQNTTGELEYIVVLFFHTDRNAWWIIKASFLSECLLSLWSYDIGCAIIYCSMSLLVSASDNRTLRSKNYRITS